MRARAVALVSLSLLVSCAGRGIVPHVFVPQELTRSAASTTQVNWTMWGFDRSRTGYNPSETTLSAANVAGQAKKWIARISSAYIDTQPIVLGSIQRLYVGDEAGRFYALNTSTGSVAWSVQLGSTTETGCSGTIAASSSGITSSPVYDAASNRLYVLDAQGVLRALDPSTGAESPGFAPVTVFKNPKIDHAWSALQMRGDGSAIYFATASHCDSGTYYGVIGRVNTSTQAIRRFTTVADKSAYYGNGVWGWGSPTIDPDTGDVYAGIGNSLGSTGESGQYSDSVIELSGSLSFVADEEPETGNLSGDLDIGSTPTLFDYGGSKCLAFSRKDGAFFTVDRRALHDNSYAAKLSLGGNIATPAYDPVTHSLYLTAANGLTKLTVESNCTATLAWQTATGGSSYQTPVIANGVVYVGGGSVLYAINAVTGKVLWTSGKAIGGVIVAAPAVVNGAVYVAAHDGSVYKFAL